MPDDFGRLESEFFRALNRVVEPWIGAGAGSPGLIPVGLVTLETIGRVSGEPRPVPLGAYLHAGHLIVGTIRGDRSHWLRNLVANPKASCSLWGGRHAVSATVWRPGQLPLTPPAYPLTVRMLVGAMIPLTTLGYSFAVLAPEDPRGRL